ncbi:MAG: hypothetical protein GX621_17455 [Pirellulaceae bacterium]|nr:hypothetical protein [Pirellulaceae bacterium]
MTVTLQSCFPEFLALHADSDNSAGIQPPVLHEMLEAIPFDEVVAEEIASTWHDALSDGRTLDSAVFTKVERLVARLEPLLRPLEEILDGRSVDGRLGSHVRARRVLSSVASTFSLAAHLRLAQGNQQSALETLARFAWLVFSLWNSEERETARLGYRYGCCLLALAIDAMGSEHVSRENGVAILHLLRRTAPSRVGYLRAAFQRDCVEVIDMINSMGSKSSLNEMIAAIDSHAAFFKELVNSVNSDPEGESTAARLWRRMRAASVSLGVAKGLCHDNCWGTVASVLKDHPSPFEPTATARIVGDGITEFAEWSALPSSQFLRRSDAYWMRLHEGDIPEFDMWPIEVSLVIPTLPVLPRRRVASLGETLKEVQNPLGRLLARDILREVCGMSLSFDWLLWFGYMARLEGACAVVAIRAYELDKQKLPARLDELVSEGLLDRIPTDPFAERELIYQPERRRITVDLNEEEMTAWTVPRVSRMVEWTF